MSHHSGDHPEASHDPVTGTKTTGHVWDGITELDTPLPRWWLWIFYATIAFSVVYWILMPAWPGLKGYTPGLLNQSDRANVARDLDDLKALRHARAAGLRSASLEQIEADPKLQAFALAAGASAFGDNCATCHGSGGTGAKGYPNLRDDVWLWGGSLEDIAHTITVGVRSSHPDTRQSMMPAFGRDGLLTAAQVDDAAQFVVQISGRRADPASAARGAAVFAEQCASCHGPEGKGNQVFGAPDLTDGDWLYSSAPEAIRSQIWNGRNGVMPTWQSRLDPETIKALAVYVHANAAGK